MRKLIIIVSVVLMFWVYAIGDALMYEARADKSSVLAVNAKGACTAFPVAEGKYLTAKHCLPVTTVGQLTVIKSYPHPTLDVALLVTVPDNAPWTKNAPKPLRLARKAPKFGEALRVPGYALGEYKGVWAGLAAASEWEGFGAMTVEAMPGMSGSPVINDWGHVVGVASKMFRPWGHPAHLSWYVPVGEFREWLIPLLEE